MNKRKRLGLNVKHNSVWDSILQSWSIIKDLSPLKDSDGNRSFQFIVQNEPVIITALGSSSGLNSIVYLLQFKQKEYILKQHQPTSDNNIPGDVEAEMQIYAARKGFAPRCLAYTGEAILIEKCQELQWSREVDCYKYKRGLNSDLRGEYNMLRNGMSENGQRVLALSKRMGVVGMYNMDQNPENYMLRTNGEFVQIDYGMNRFSTVGAFEKFHKHLTKTLPYTKKELREMLLDNSVAYPPAYYWWRYFIKDNKGSHVGWDETMWDVAIGQIEARISLICEQLNDQHSKQETTFANMRLKF